MNEEDCLCMFCQGSGEGMYEGSTCFYCKGSGVMVFHDQELNSMVEDRDYWEDELQRED